jgi:gas vesicle protein
MMRNFLTGLGLGFGVGMLIAPQSGEETRDQLRARIGAIGSRAEEAGDELRERAGDSAEELRGRMQDVAARVRRQAEQFGDTWRDKVGDLRSPRSYAASSERSSRRPGAERHRDSNARDSNARDSNARSSNATGRPAQLLNNGSREELLAVYGIGPVLADRIIQNRPYSSVEEAVERDVVSQTVIAELRLHFTRKRPA